MTPSPHANASHGSPSAERKQEDLRWKELLGEIRAGFRRLGPHGRLTIILEKLDNALAAHHIEMSRDTDDAISRVMRTPPKARKP